MVLKKQSSFANMTFSTQSSSESMVSKPQLPQFMDQRATIISRKDLELPFFFDRCFDKNRIKTFIGWLLANFGENTTVYIVEKLKNLGFYFATEAGISLSIDDLQVPLNKNWFLSQAEKDIRRNHNNFQCGNLTPVEQSQQLLDRWHQTSEILRESVIQSFRLTNTLNPVYMMAFSGARGNISQVRQLVGMRGLMADPQGQIISFPIRSNFREGLTLTEYVISCYGARKGVVDTALRTADSGYLTRRLVDVSQHVVVWTFDCKTDAGIHLTEMKEGKKVILSLKKRILGRVLAQEIPTIAFRNQQISAQLAQQIASLREYVLVRSPLSCSVPNSVCQLCYGWSLSRGRIVSLGEAVGVIAAQSIGEPGTQLTMRTFHTGGVFSGDVIDEIRAPHDGLVHFLQPLLGQLIRTSHGKIAYLTRASGSFIIKNSLTQEKVEYLAGENPIRDFVPQDENGLQLVVPNQHFASQSMVPQAQSFFQEESMNQTILNLEPGTALFVRQGEKVIAKQLLAEYSSISAQTKERVEALHQVYSDQKGEIFFDDVLLGKKLKKEESETEKESILDLQNKLKQDASQKGDAKMNFGKNHETEFFEHFAEQNIQKIDPQSGRKIDIVTSLKLNTLWVLSGTFFEPPIFSPLYTKIGDLVDKTTLLTLIQNELNLQTPHLDKEYTLSVQLKKKKITKRKEKLLTFFRKNLVSSKFPKILQREGLEGHMKKKDSLFLNEFSLNLIITNIKYKKSGYFFTNSKKEKPSNFYPLFLQVGNVNLLTGSKVNYGNATNSLQSKDYAYGSNNIINFRNYKENNKVSNWNLVFRKTKIRFPSDVFLQSQKIENVVVKEKYQLFVGREINCIFVLAEPKQIRAFFLKPNALLAKKDFGISKDYNFCQNTFWHHILTSENINGRHFATNKNVSFFQKKTNLISINKKNQSFLTENLVLTSHFGTQNIQKLRENKKNVNHFFTTTSLNQPFSNRREFKNEFVLQWFSHDFKTETGGLIYTNNYYCNKRSLEAHIFLIAEENYGKKNLGKMNFGKRKISFHIVSFKELIAPSICLANVPLSGKKKPISSFKNFFVSLSEDLGNILFINRSVEDKHETKGEKLYNNLVEPDILQSKKIVADAKIDFGKQQDDFSSKISFDKKQLKRNFVRSGKVISINSLLSETSFLQNQSLNKELFFLRKKNKFNFYSVCFHSTKIETFNSAVNLLRKGFLSFKSKWVETDKPLGYQKNLQGSQIPFYSTKNGVLKNNLTPSFFTNPYSNYWSRKKDQKLSGSFLKNFFSFTFKYPLSHIKVKKGYFDTKRVCLVDSLYLNKNKFLGRNDILIKNFHRKPINEKLYQKEFWLASQERKAPKVVDFISQNDSQNVLHQQNIETPSFLHSKQKIRFYLAPLLIKLRLNLTKKKTLKFNPFPSKGNYSSSAFIFRINMRAISFNDLQKESSLFYNPYPYSQPLFLEFLQNKSTANFHYLTKGLGPNLDLQNKHVILESKTLSSKCSLLNFQETKPPGSFGLQVENSNVSQEDAKHDLTRVKASLQNKSKKDISTLHLVEQNLEKEKQENNLKNKKVVEDYSDILQSKMYPQNIISRNTPNNSQNRGFEEAHFLVKQEHQDKKFNRFSSFLQKQIKKISTKKQKKTAEKSQKLNLQIRPGWLYLPKDQFQTAKVHQSFIPPFQQNIDEILFDQFPVYIESILRKNFEEQLVDKYLQPSTNAVDFYKTKTLVEKSQLQKFINQISTVSRKSKQSVKGLRVSRERSNKFLLSLRETFWRGSTFSSFIEKNFTTSHHNNKTISKLGEKDSLCETNLPTNSLNHTKISSRSSFLSFLLRNKKDKKDEKLLFLRPVSINPVKIVFQVVTNKSCRLNSIQSFTLSYINNVNFDFSQDFFLQSQIIDRKLSQGNTSIGREAAIFTDAKMHFGKQSIEKKVNPKFFLCLPQISRIYFVKNKPFSDFVLVSRPLNFDSVKIKSYIFSDKKTISYKSENEVSTSFSKEKQGHGHEATILMGGYFVEKTFGEISNREISKSNVNEKLDQIKSKEQNLAERVILSEKNKDLICKGRHILISINKTSYMFSFGKVESKRLNQHKNLSKILQNKTFLIENLSAKINTDYSSFLILIPNSLKDKKGANIITSIPEHSVAALPQSFSESMALKAQLPQAMEQNGGQVKNVVFDDTQSFQRKEPSFYEFFKEKSKLWLLIRQVAEYPLLNTSIFQQKAKLYKGNQTFFEKELIYSSTPLSLYLSNRITFSSKFNKQKKKEIYLSFYHSPKVSLKIRESLFYLLDTFSKFEKQNFANLSTDLTRNAFGTFCEIKCKDKVKFDNFSETKIKENKLKLPLNLFFSQKIFWQIFDLYRQNLQKKKFFDGKQLIFIKKIFDTERENILKEKTLSQESPLFYKVTVQKRTWSFQKENLENFIFSQEKDQTIIRSFKQSYLLHFFLNFNISKQSPLQRIEIKTTFEKIEGSTQTSSCAHHLNSQKIETNENFIEPKFFSEKPKFWRYSFTPFARNLSLTLSFIAKLNQSWFFSLTNNVKNKTGAFQLSTLQNKKPIKRVFIYASKTRLNEKNTKQEYLEDKKSISKESISYSLKEKSSYTTLLLDQTITTHDKSPVARTAIMSREEGEIESLKNNSASLILKNSDIDILLTKKEKPLVVVGQLIRYGEQIANGIGAPKSGQIIQVDSNRVTLRKAQPILFPRGGSVDVNHGDYVKEGSPLLSLSYQRLVTGDIVQGIPKIEQLFEARETEGGQPLLSSLHSELEGIFLSYSTQLGLKLAVRESFKEIQQIIVDRVQRVYIAQGVLIADKHFEVVIRQMTSKVRILDGGRPGFLYGELVDLRRVELLNAGVPFANEQAVYEPIILGISKACLEAEGFLSPASFQETTRVLSLAAIERKTDFLRGIKERVILGDVIQAGTGFALYDRPIRKIKQEECIDLSLSILHNAYSILSTNQYYKQL